MDFDAVRQCEIECAFNIDLSLTALEDYRNTIYYIAIILND